jgi:hypothetical protein
MKKLYGGKRKSRDDEDASITFPKIQKLKRVDYVEIVLSILQPPIISPKATMATGKSGKSGKLDNKEKNNTNTKSNQEITTTPFKPASTTIMPTKKKKRTAQKEEF